MCGCVCPTQLFTSAATRLGFIAAGTAASPRQPEQPQPPSQPASAQHSPRAGSADAIADIEIDVASFRECVGCDVPVSSASLALEHTIIACCLLTACRALPVS